MCYIGGSYSPRLSYSPSEGTKSSRFPEKTKGLSVIFIIKFPNFSSDILETFVSISNLQESFVDY